MTEIVTERLRLRPARADDLDAFHAILSDPVAMRYWSSRPHPDLARTREWLDDMIAAPADQSLDFVLEKDGAVIGKAGCWRLPEIGYILAPPYWGQGFAREALQAIIPAVFACFDIPAITADVDPRNTASVGLLLRLGFHETGRAANSWKVGDEWSDSVYLALPRP
jgi:RimJ/RimL family protein N-acetyltransferase